MDKKIFTFEDIWRGGPFTPYVEFDASSSSDTTDIIADTMDVIVTSSHSPPNHYRTPGFGFKNGEFDHSPAGSKIVVQVDVDGVVQACRPGKIHRFYFRSIHIALD